MVRCCKTGYPLVLRVFRRYLRLKLKEHKEPAGFGPSVYSGADGERQGLGEGRSDWAKEEEEKWPPLLSIGVTGRGLFYKLFKVLGP